VEGAPHDDADILIALAESGARLLLIGRRALVALGLPMLTADYDVWIHTDDIERLNAAMAPLDFVPTRSPEEARSRGRYVLEDGDHIDVMVARSQAAPDGEHLAFDDAWSRRQPLAVSTSSKIHLPHLEDLISTKRWGGRPRDLMDIEALEALRRAP
jgi:hypothetical protein